MKPLAEAKTARLPGSVERYGLTDEDAAEFLGVNVWTLRTWRTLTPPRGPRFRRVGRCIRYCLVDLKTYWDSLPAGGEGATDESR